MRFLNFLFLSILCFCSFKIYSKDFAFVEDEDGYVNVREQASLSSKIVGKLKNNDTVRCVSTDESPTFCFINSSNGINGYVYKNRLNFFKDYQKINLINYQDNKSVFSGKDLRIQFSSEKNSPKNKFRMVEFKSGNKIILGNNEVYGTDDSIPDYNFSYLTEILVRYNGKSNIIGLNQLNGLFFPTKGLQKRNELANFQIYALKEDMFIFNTFNNGGAGEYNVCFYFKKGILQKKMIWRTVL